MSDLRQILSQGRKRIALLVGAGAPLAIRVNADGNRLNNSRIIILKREQIPSFPLGLTGHEKASPPSLRGPS
ncbi:hypothetical protein DI458_01305 [Burkholderia contaminans]|nr:hypothetical protein [Burkholderia contaminans]MBA9841707.1 hypothetical protein [Burkholderia contaminans]MBA9866803.1 hypothetical protein [Burkholderia contaminans]MBA9909484.1 hypothetical protein [Burkholderia contaminans]MBA9933097.1 hypothetical protein [Burkholderia contaminans]